MRHDERVEGNLVREGVLSLGMRAADTASVATLLHEMAHFIEIDDARCLMNGWGLRTTKVLIAGQLCQEPRTFEACEREIRVMAIELALGTHLGVVQRPRQLARLLGWVPGNFFGFERYGLSPRHDSLEKLYDVVAVDLERRTAKLDVGVLWTEWRRKCALHDARLG